LWVAVHGRLPTGQAACLFVVGLNMVLKGIRMLVSEY